MAKSFVVKSSQFAVILSGDETTNHYYTAIRMEVRGCATKDSQLSGWHGEGNTIYYGQHCHLPEGKGARKFLKEVIRGHKFLTKLKRHIDAKHRYETKEEKKLILNRMFDKLNHLIENSFSPIAN